MRTVFSVLVVAVLCPLASLTAQARGARLPRLDGRRLPLQVDTFAVFLVRGSDTTRTGSVVDEVRADQGRLMRIYTASDRVLGEMLDTIVDVLRDLRPIAIKTRSSERVASLRYDSSNVSGWVRLPNGDSTTVQVPLSGPVFDGASFDLVVRASDLAEGDSLVAPSFIIGPNTVSPIAGAVVGSTLVDGHACWIFKANFAGMPVTFWIDKETRALRRQLMQLRVDIGILFTHPATPRSGRRAT